MSTSIRICLSILLLLNETSKLLNILGENFYETKEHDKKNQHEIKILIIFKTRTFFDDRL